MRSGFWPRRRGGAGEYEYDVELMRGSPEYIQAVQVGFLGVLLTRDCPVIGLLLCRQADGGDLQTDSALFWCLRVSCAPSGKIPFWKGFADPVLFMDDSRLCT